MNKPDIMKRFLALLVSFSMAAGAFSASADDDLQAEDLSAQNNNAEYGTDGTDSDTYGYDTDYAYTDSVYDGEYTDNNTDTDNADGTYTADYTDDTDGTYGYDDGSGDDYGYDYDYDTADDGTDDTADGNDYDGDYDYDADYDNTDSVDSQYTAEDTQYDDTDSDDTADTESYEENQTAQADTSVYSQRLAEIAEEQERIEQELADAESDMADETEKQQLLLKKINNLNEKISVVNSYMTQLEMEISTNREQTDNLKTEVDEGITAYKKRLRAMYIAGDTSYADVVLNSGDFFDVLMRSELVKRVTSFDANMLDELVAKKAEYEEKVTSLESEQAEYDKQTQSLEEDKETLTKLYNSSSKTKALLKEQKESLEKEQETYEAELSTADGSLGSLLKGTYGSSADETQRLETETEASQKISELRKEISESDDVSDDDCQYNFKWPVPGNYYVSSGVGERWGTYHKGLDITGDSGTKIYAAEAGTVVSMNNSCTHNYGKSGSCGCGGGYGNYIIIDHGNGFLTLYGHLTKAEVAVGDTVKQGDEIGLMGTTGYSTGTHLHFELRYNGYITNPAAFLKL